MHRKPPNINLNKDSVHLHMWSSSAEKALEVLIEPGECQAAKANKPVLR